MEEALRLRVERSHQDRRPNPGTGLRVRLLLQGAHALQTLIFPGRFSIYL